MTKDEGPGTRDTARLRVLFINRMASMERGGGETFDLEMARHLARMGHRVTFLSGIPLFGRTRCIDSIQYSVSSVRNDEDGCSSMHQVSSELNTEHRTLNTIRSITLRAPMFPWYPWDRVKGGWRVRVAEFWLFEKLAARWAWKHRNEFDIIQVCELPTFVSTFKTKDQGRRPKDAPKVIMRLTAPNVFDPGGGVQKADALIASGTTVGKIRRTLRTDCEDVPNAVDPNRFQVSGFRFQDEDKNRSPVVFSEPYANRKLAELDSQRCVGAASSNDIAGNNQPPTCNLQPSTSAAPPPSGRLPLCGDAATCNLLYVARFQAFKRHDILIEAFARVLEERPDSRLILVGSGPLLRQVKQSVQCSVFSVQRNLRPGLGMSEKQDKVMPSGVEASPAHRWLWRFLDFVPQLRDSAHDSADKVGRGRRTRRDAPGGPALPRENMLSNKQLDDAISFLGEVPYEQLPDIYTSADIKVISSDYESFCFAALEAMASGLPIVATDCGWVPILIGDTFPPVEKQWYTGAADGAGRFEEDEPGRRLRHVPGGVVVGRNDPESLARAILELAQDEDRRKACGQWNREKAVREHGWEASAEKLAGVYERVLSKE